MADIDAEDEADVLEAEAAGRVPPAYTKGSPAYKEWEKRQAQRDEQAMRELAVNDLERLIAGNGPLAKAAVTELRRRGR